MRWTVAQGPRPELEISGEWIDEANGRSLSHGSNHRLVIFPFPMRNRICLAAMGLNCRTFRQIHEHSLGIGMHQNCLDFIFERIQKAQIEQIDELTTLQRCKRIKALFHSSRFFMARPPSDRGLSILLQATFAPYLRREGPFQRNLHITDFILLRTI